MRNHNGTRRVLPAALAVGALLVIALVGTTLLDLHRGHSSVGTTAPSPVPSTPPVPVPSGAVPLVQGERTADGIEIGYPHTLVGAISAAAEYIDAVASTLDSDYAASVMRLAGDPADSTLAADVTHSSIGLRAVLQLPTSGPLLPPTAFLTTAQMYQLRDVSPDRVLVLLLTSCTFINAHGGTAHTTGVFPAHMHWTGGDWKLAAIGGAGEDYSGLTAKPNTQAAVDQGWQTLIAITGGAP